MAQYIDKIGIELELGVKRTESGALPSVKKFNHVADGSISVSRRKRDNGFKAREYVSKPCDYNKNWTTDDLNELESGLYRLYKTHEAFGNDSMGTHVHMSFRRPIWKQALASMKFQKHLIKKIEDSDLYDRNKRLRERLDGVQYSKPFKGHQGIQSTINGSRSYRHFTFRSETIEFRVMPAFNKKRDVRAAVNLLAEAVNSFLWNKKHEFEEQAELKSDKSDSKGVKVEYV